MQKITLVAAMAKNLCIGNHQQIPWHIPEDFQFFKQYTLNKPIIMGRKTWESLPKKPLPQRRNIIISRKNDYQADGAEVVTSITEALALCIQYTEICIIGGAEIYQQALHLATDMRLTEIDIDIQGDAFFPKFDHHIWQETDRVSQISIKGLSFDFVHYYKK